MLITDTHAHLYSEAFDGEQDEMIQRAISAGVDRFFVPAIDSTYTQAMLNLAMAYPDRVFLMSGLHPTHVKENYREELAHVEEQLSKHTYYAVGEIGMDLYWDTTYQEQQQDAFRYQIRLALQHKLPIVIHCRDAFDPIFEILEEFKGKGVYGIFHCFTGTLAQAHRAIGLGMKLGIGGVVTFKNGKIDQFLDQIDMEHLVLETDAPYLAPVPYRGKRNESAYIIHVVEKLAMIYKSTPQEVGAVTTANAIRVFGV